MINIARLPHQRVTRFVGAAGLTAALAVGGFALTNGPSGAATFSCPNFNDTDIPTPPPNTTGYLFIGTNISTTTSSITVTYTGGSQTVAGEQQGNGAFHYVVYIPQGATVTNATVTGATDQTVVTVSGCLQGAVVTTTTAAPTTTTGAPTTTTGTPTTQPAAPTTQPAAPTTKPAAPKAQAPRSATPAPRQAVTPTPVTGASPRTTG